MVTHVHMRGNSVLERTLQIRVSEPSDVEAIKGYA